MAPSTDYPHTIAERLIAGTIKATWVLYALGALYIAGPLLGWTLALMGAARLYLRLPSKIGAPVTKTSLSIPFWLLGMGTMLLALIIGHAINDLGVAQTIKSAFGWAKGWALLALFPFAGAVLDIRATVIYRAMCILGIQTLILLPILLAAPHLGLPGQLYVSPLSVLGGSSDEFFTVVLYTIDPSDGADRWQFFAPWSPAAGMAAVVMLLCAIEEREVGRRIAGIVAGVTIAWLSQSRMALLAVVVIWPVARLVGRMRTPAPWIVGAPIALLAGCSASAITALASNMVDRFNGARADSSRVRATLGRIAVERWQSEAPWFGHGIVERGPHIVEYMPIGSHHSWYGLLFVKGIVGAAALGIPLAYNLCSAAVATIADRPGARVGFSMLLVLTFYSFGENLEVLGYLYWPALVLIGLASRQADGELS